MSLGSIRYLSLPPYTKAPTISRNIQVSGVVDLADRDLLGASSPYLVYCIGFNRFLAVAKFPCWNFL